MRVHRAVVETDLGTWVVAGTERGLGYLGLTEARVEAGFDGWLASRGLDPADVHDELGSLEPAARQLREYAAGERREFDLELDLVGSDFELAVWDEAALSTLLAELQAEDLDLDALGWSDEELSQLLGSVPAFAPTSADDQHDLDRLAPKLCPHCGKDTRVAPEG